MGEVFVAENLAIGMRVAVKVLKPELLADAEFRQRFQQEAQAMAAIEHRNVARFLDLRRRRSDLHGHGVRAGRDARRVAQAARLALERALAIARRLCWAWRPRTRPASSTATSSRPTCILAPDPEIGEEPKLIDFGLAKLAAVAAARQLTRTGQIIGTPEYMSPEQMANKPSTRAPTSTRSAASSTKWSPGRPPFDQGDEVQVLYARCTCRRRRCRTSALE